MRKRTTDELHAKQASDSTLAVRHPIYVVCDNIRSLHNVGQIFRLCDAARVERLFLCGITGYPPLPDDARPSWVAERAGRLIAKTAIETVSHVPWEFRPDAAEVIRELRQRGTQIVALEQTTNSTDYARAQYRFPVCLVLGHERQGVGSEVLGLTDLTVEVPMYGVGNSLNVAAAFGICVYELVRRCQGPPVSLSRNAD